MEKNIKTSHGNRSVTFRDEPTPLTYQEKKQLRLDLEALPADKLANVIEACGAPLRRLAAKELTVDLEKMKTPTQRRLQRFVLACRWMKCGKKTYGVGGETETRVEAAHCGKLKDAGRCKVLGKLLPDVKKTKKKAAGERGFRLPMLHLTS